MSADSLRKQSKQGNHGQVILPQAINDPSIIESVAGFIHEVVPQAYSSVLPGESRDSILWARFDSTDYNDPENFPQLSDCESESTLPLLLVLGYSSGVQVWSVGGSGEATELLSWCQGAVRALRFLLKPTPRDPHSSKRPLVAIVDSSSPGPQFSTLSFISLKTAEVVKIIKFNSPICDVHCNHKSIVITFNERIAVFDSATLEDRLTITTCYLSPGNSPNPIALGTRWLAYGEKRLTTWQRSSGGCEGDGAQSYTSAVIHAAKSLGKGLRELGGSLTGSSPQTTQNAHAQPGIVSVIDIERKGGSSEEERGNMIAHFVAHTSAVVALAFDPSGLLLVTADRHGHRFNVFRIHPHPCTSQLAAVHHLYILHRGETTARVQDIAVSWDSRWVAISSVRGTTHVFPITPYGGLVTVRTHTTPHVVNRLSRFERSAGLRDGRGSPLPCEVPPTPPPPRLPPYPHPSVITPLAQLRARPEDSPLAATFGPPRAWLPGKPKSKRTCADSLYVISNSGVLLQYDLDPKCVQGVAKDKISYDTAIEVGVEAKAEWVLPKPPYSSSLCPPLPPGHVLVDLPPRPQPPPDKWLSQVEIVTHTGPHRRLWMGPQFTFKSIDPLPSSGCDEGGIDGGNPLRSNPVNMPHRPYLLVETSSGGSVGSPQTDSDEAGGRLREDLADAMLETQLSSGQARGKLRRAEVEWQVNPLGAVQTHPIAVVTHWPHPIFYEPFTVDVPKEQQPDVIQLSAKDRKMPMLPSNILVSPTFIETGNEKDFKNPTYSSISQSAEHASHEISESVIEIEEKMESGTSCSSRPTDSLDANKNFETPVQKQQSRNDLSREQSEVSSSDKEATSAEKTVPQPQEVEEKSSRSNRKARKKKSGNDKKGKKDLLKSSSSNESSTPSLPIPLESYDNKEFKSDSESITHGSDVENVLKLSAKVSEGITDSITIDKTYSCYEKGESSNNPIPSSSFDLSPIDKVEAEVAHEIQPETLKNVEVTHHEIETFESNIIPEHHSAQVGVITWKSNQGIDSKLIEMEDSEAIYNVEIDIDEHYESDSYPLLMKEDFLETEILDTTASISLVEESLQPFASEPTSTPATEDTLVLLMESDMNGNEPLVVSSREESAQEELLIFIESPVEENKNNEQIHGERCSVGELTNVSLEDDSENFTTVPSRSSRGSKSKRKKKEKKSFESSQLADISEVDIFQSSSVKQTAVIDVTSVQNDFGDTNIKSEASTIVEEELCTSEAVTDVISVKEDEDNIKEKDNGCIEQCVPEEAINLPVSDSPPLFQEEAQSDQVASTDRSEVEDISSHSGKESDDSKVNKKERSRKQKRSESSDKDHSDGKKKSPSPATGRAEVKDSESSDESNKNVEPKSLIQKVPKRKKGKKLDETLTEPSILSKVKEDCLETVKISILSSSSKDKSSESSNENGSERIIRKQKSSRSWSSIVSNADQRNSSVDDRDSVYESCNDDGASDSLAFESSKEDFDESMLKAPLVEIATCSNTEERTDSSDKTNQPLLKKVKKQKKKKR